MRTTLKRGVGRGAGLNGNNGHAVLPPTAVSSVVKYRSPQTGRTGLGLLTRILLGTLLILAGLGLAVAGGALLWFHESISAVRAHSVGVKIAQKQLNSPPMPGHAAIALVIGYDQRKGVDFSDVSRSDTVMLIRADPGTDTVSLMSIPRDLGVPIYCPKWGATSRGLDKINQAYADCGPQGTVDTVKHFTNLPINYLITVNFHGFKEIVDKLGGIWLDVDRRYYHVNDGSAAQNYANINLRPGYQLLTGEQALSFVRYRHTDDDYHRIARQQQFVRALKQQFSKDVNFTELPGIVNILTRNVEVGGNPSDTTVLSWMRFGLGLPGGHFFQDRIEGITGFSQTSTDPANIEKALYQFTHPDVHESKVANAAALGTKAKASPAAAPPASETSVLVLNGNGVAGSAADGAFQLRQRGYLTVLPPGNLSPNAPTQGYFHTLIYYDATQAGSEAAANQLSKLFVPSDVKPFPKKNRKLQALNPGAQVMVILGETYHNELQVPPPAPPAPKHQPPSVRTDTSTGLELLQPFLKRVRFTLEAPTVLEQSSYPDNQYGDQAARMYWIDRHHHDKAVRLTFRTGAGEYWGIEETDMPNPPVLSDKSFQRAIKGREFQLYYTGSHLHMVVLRVHDRSYWVVNTLLDSLSNETMLTIATGLKPLTGHKSLTGHK
jgi:LCP family protein required for cell wall assembly